MNIWSLFARRNGESGSYLVNKNGFSLYEVLFLESIKKFHSGNAEALTGLLGLRFMGRPSYAEERAGGHWEGPWGGFPGLGWLLPIDF